MPVKNRAGGALVGGLVLGAALAVSAPAVGTQVQRAFDADNADRVDGRHAVGAGASIDKRKGRLVATGRDGRLPDDIIAVAPDAARLDGVPADDYRFLPLDSGAAYLNGGALFLGGLRLPNSGTPSFGWDWALPPDYRPGSPVTLVLNVVPSVAGGSVIFAREFSSFGRPGSEFNGNAADPIFRTVNPLPTPVVRRVEIFEVEVVPPDGVASFQPGDIISIGLRRDAAADANNDAVFIRSAGVRY